MIDCLIFSKNRACQLDLLLRSIEENFWELKSINILYLATDPIFKAGYDKVIDKFRYYNWIEQSDFVADTKQIINSFKQPFSVIFVDDEVAVSDFKVKPYLKFMKPDFTDLKVHALSLRMHPEVTYTYTANVPSPKIDFVQVSKDLVGWDWTKYDTQATTGLPCEAGYPSCINSHIYYTMFLQMYINNLKFDNANSLEGMFNLCRSNFNPHMLCFKHPKTINIAANLVQTGTNRYSKSIDNTVENLNAKYLAGYVIDEKLFYGMKRNTPTFEHPYAFRKA